MLDTTEAAMTEANDFQDSSGVFLSSERCDIPLTITHSMFILWAAANSPANEKKTRPYNMKMIVSAAPNWLCHSCSIHCELKNLAETKAQTFSPVSVKRRLRTIVFTTQLSTWQQQSHCSLNLRNKPQPVRSLHFTLFHFSLESIVTKIYNGLSWIIFVP